MLQGIIYLPFLLKSGSQQTGYYVDSVGGNDANNGRSQATPFKTIARLMQEQIKPYCKINLARGSHWREQLTIMADNVQVKAYGSGLRPILDCSDIVTSFAQTAGQSNVYQADITTNHLSYEPAFVSVWENGKRLVLADSLAACDTTPGSYYVANHNATNLTVYVHYLGGKTYEVSTRLAGIYSYFAQRLTVDGIHCKRNYSNGGSLKVGPGSVIRDCLLSEGNKHNALARTGSCFYNCVFEDAYSTEGATMLVINEDSPAGESSVISNCVFRLSNPAAPGSDLIAPMNAHHNVSGDFGAFIIEDCTFENFRTAGLMVFPNNAAHFYLINPTYLNCRVGITPCGAAGYTVIGGVFTSNVAGQRAINLTSPGSPVLIDGLVINQEGTVEVGEMLITAAYTAIFRNVVLNAGSDVRAALYCTNPGANITIENLQCCNLGAWSWIYNIEAGQFASDRNRFGGSNFKMIIGGVTYTSLAAYQAATGQDMNSTVGGC